MRIYPTKCHQHVAGCDSGDGDGASGSADAGGSRSSNAGGGSGGDGRHVVAGTAADDNR